MRIMMLADFYPPIVGGVEQHVRNLSIELAARGHNVSVVTLWHPGLAETEIDNGVRVYRVRGSVQRVASLFKDPDRRYAPPAPDPEVTWAMRRIVAREHPEIVHAHNWLVHSFLPLKLWSGARLVMTLHDYSLICARKTLLKQDGPCSGPGLGKCLSCSAGQYGLTRGAAIVLANRGLTPIARTAVDLFLPVSQAVASAVGLPLSNQDFQVVPSFLADDHTPETAATPYLAQLPQEPYLLFVGALGRHKGIEVLLEAHAQLHAAPPLVLIGQRMNDTPTEYPPNVVVLNDWPNFAVRRAWPGSLAGVVPSVWAEPFGMVALEAMAAARPVVASRVGGLSDLVVDGETGLVVPPNDPVALAHALERLIARPDLREHLGAAARRRVAAFHADAVVPQIEGLYRDLCSQAHSRTLDRPQHSATGWS
jgi:glycosyltransferase involved in cell wall biosynthesis